MYTIVDYEDAINFALNYPDNFEFVEYYPDSDLYEMQVFDNGWWHIKLDGYYIRSCLKWKGKKVWKIKTDAKDVGI